MGPGFGLNIFETRLQLAFGVAPGYRLRKQIIHGAQGVAHLAQVPLLMSIRAIGLGLFARLYEDDLSEQFRQTEVAQ